MVIHVVKPGDSLFSIGKKYGVNYLKIAKDNELLPEQTLVVGQTVVVLNGETKKLGKLTVNGYAYPNISDNTLNKTLPNLTYLSIFAYQPTATGELSDLDDTRVLALCKKSTAQPVMVIANMTDDGFSTELAEGILANATVQDNLLTNAMKIMEQKGYKGLDIDFEYLFPKDVNAYNSFVQKASERLHSAGYFLSTALAPKTSRDQKGRLYEAHDYNFHGKFVDHVILMTYEWGYTYSAPMAVAPLPQVEKVISYAVTEIPPDKILMGIPNYGYDWNLPHVEGTAAKSIGNYRAVELARSANVAISFDEKSQSPFFNYVDKLKKRHEVWFEDARSIEAKLLLANKYKLEGVSYWTINNFFPQNWLVLNALFDVNKE